MTLTSKDSFSQVDLDAAARLVDQLEHDLEELRAGQGDTERLRAEVAALSALLAADSPKQAQVNASLHNLRASLQALGDELFTDAVTSSDYLARIGRLLGLS